MMEKHSGPFSGFLKDLSEVDPATREVFYIESKPLLEARYKNKAVLVLEPL